MPEQQPFLMSEELQGADIFTATPLFSFAHTEAQNSHATNDVAAARALNLQDAGAHEERMLAYEKAIRSLETKCQILEETARLAEINHKEEATSLREAVRGLNAENEELVNDVQELLGETEELQQTLKQVVSKGRTTEEAFQRLKQEQDSLLEQLENDKNCVQEEDPQEEYHWKSTMRRKLKLISEEKIALENALSLANAEKDHLSDEYAKQHTEVNLLKEDVRQKKAVIEILQNAHQSIALKDRSGFNEGKAFFGGAIRNRSSSLVGSIAYHRRGGVNTEHHRRASVNAYQKQTLIRDLINAILPRRDSNASSSSSQQRAMERNRFQNHPPLCNDALGETEELQQTLKQVVRDGRDEKEDYQRLKLEQDSFLEQLENDKNCVQEEDPQEEYHWKSTMRRKLKLIYEEKIALENALSLADAEKDHLSDEYAKQHTEVNLLKEDVRQKKAVIEILQKAYQSIALKGRSGFNEGKVFFDGAIRNRSSSLVGSIAYHRRGGVNTEYHSRVSVNADQKQTLIGDLINAILPRHDSNASSSSSQQRAMEINRFRNQAAVNCNPSEFQRPVRSISVGYKNSMNDLKLSNSGSCAIIPPVVPFFFSKLKQDRNAREKCAPDQYFPPPFIDAVNTTKSINPVRINTYSGTNISATVGDKIWNISEIHSSSSPITEDADDTSASEDDEYDENDPFQLIVGFRQQA